MIMFSFFFLFPSNIIENISKDIKHIECCFAHLGNLLQSVVTVVIRMMQALRSNITERSFLGS